MEVKEQIRAYRSSLGLSQEELAEAVYVTRQTVSNWETGKSYPDIQSLLRLSALYGVSLDQLIKGDAERMKEKINDDEIRAFNRLSNVFALMMVLSLLAWAPLAYFLHWWGMPLALILFAFTLFLALRVEKKKEIRYPKLQGDCSLSGGPPAGRDQQGPGSGKAALPESTSHFGKRCSCRCVNRRTPLAFFTLVQSILNTG